MGTLSRGRAIPMKRSLATAAAIGIVAYGVMDMVHEAGGHWLASSLVPGVHPLMISTVAVRSHGFNRIVSAAGTTADLIAGAIALWLFSRRPRLTPATFFVWLFGTVNLMNIGYLAYSGVFAIGDWSSVIRGLPDPLLWRIALVIIGVAGYVYVVWLAAKLLAARTADGRDVRRMILTAYVAGSTLLLAGAALNPVKQMILTSGIASGFLCTAGLFSVAAYVARVNRPADQPSIPLRPAWLVAAILLGAVFVGILGPGVVIG